MPKPSLRFSLEGRITILQLGVTQRKVVDSAFRPALELSPVCRSVGWSQWLKRAAPAGFRAKVAAASDREIVMALVRNVFLFVVLTLLTQIGGIVFLVSIAVSRLLQISRRLLKAVVFLSLYVLATIAAHAVAPSFGRVPLPCFSAAAALQLQSPLYCVLNRNYVSVGMRQAAEDLARHMATQFPGTVTLALDANFPFIDGFPLLPHLSHSDGRKMDIAFYYRGKTGEALSGQTRSPIGYFAFEQPDAGSPLPCAGRDDLLTFRWDLKLLQPLFADWSLDEARTRAAVQWLSSEGRAAGVEKIFIEPHLVKTLAVENDTVRFQGCRAARHDDHIHFQVAK
ncbi:hypothetical protein LP421_18935 [Rhizobium sp. RCAM05350]|nr:hypothetical protein LP421_18935 [Rhizobium sp. RCAM05350]